jgi:nucleoside 2-deoxyribosyltransferase
MRRNRQTVVYLASPYSHADPAVREARFQAACQATAVLIRQGKIVFSPIVHSHSLCRYGLPGDWGFWRSLDLAYLGRCDEVVVVKLDGWRQSRGVQAEVARARALGKPVSFIEPDGVAEENPSERRG